MILIDTSVWVDHLRMPETSLLLLLEKGQVVVHPFVVGELALGWLKQREHILEDLKDLPQIAAAYHEEVLAFITDQKLFGSGIGYIDAHLLVAAQLMGDSLLWTRDKRLRSIAEGLNLAWSEPKAS